MLAKTVAATLFATFLASMLGAAYGAVQFIGNRHVLLSYATDKVKFPLRLFPFWYLLAGTLTEEGLQYRQEMLKGAKVYFLFAAIGLLCVGIWKFLETVLGWDMRVPF